MHCFLNCFTNHKKLLLNYLMIIPQLHLRINTNPSMSARIARIATFFECKVSGYSNLKIFSPKRILQKFPIALAQVKAGR